MKKCHDGSFWVWARTHLGMSTKAEVATVFTGIFAPSAASMLGFGDIAAAATKKIKLYM